MPCCSHALKADWKLVFLGLDQVHRQTMECWHRTNIDRGNTNPATCDSSTVNTEDELFSGCFFGILDTQPKGSEPSVATTEHLWTKSYPNSLFQAGASKDPVDGLWIFPLNLVTAGSQTCSLMGGTNPVDNCLLHLDFATGNLLQLPLDLGRILGTVTGGQNDKTYVPASTMTIYSSGGSNYMAIGAVHSFVPGFYDPIVMLIELPSLSTSYTYASESNFFEWRTYHGVLGGQYLPSPAYGQFAIGKYILAGTTHTQMWFTTSKIGVVVYGN